MHRNTKAISFVLFLLLELSSSLDVELCPDVNDISPCECDEDDDSGILDITCYEDQTLEELKEALSGLSGKKNIHLVIGETNLGVVPSNFFSGLDIYSLSFDHCELDSLSNDSGPGLLGLEDSLEVLVVLSSITEDNVPAKLQLGHLRNLKDLDFSSNLITEIGDEWFDKGPASLRYLSISHNGIQKLGSKAFANLINLEQLVLIGNRFSDLQRSMFPSPAENLQVIELDDNGLTSIPEDLFLEMPSLYSVFLRSNGILRLDEKSWSKVWSQLETISLEENPIECDSTMKWMKNFEIIPAVYGKCYAPRKFKDWEISDYINQQIFSY